jgi:hypothetical protein
MYVVYKFQVFYIHAAFSFFVFTLWCVLYCDKPQDSVKVSSLELEKIQRNKNDAQINGSKSIPHKVGFECSNQVIELFSGFNFRHCDHLYLGLCFLWDFFDQLPCSLLTLLHQKCFALLGRRNREFRGLIKNRSNSCQVDLRSTFWWNPVGF